MNPTKPIFLALFKEEIAKGEKCWHKVKPGRVYFKENKNMRRYEMVGWCEACNSDVPALRYNSDGIYGYDAELFNPDYTAPGGFFELKALCEKQKWWEEFVRFAWLKYGYERETGCMGCLASSCGLPHEVIETPLTFATVVYEFLKERGDIK